MNKTILLSILFLLIPCYLWPGTSDFLTLTPKDELFVYHRGDPINLILKLPLALKDEILYLDLTVSNYKGQVICKRNFTTTKEKQVEIKLDLQQDITHWGVFFLQTTCKDSKGATHCDSTTSFAIIPDVRLKSACPDSPFGIGSYYAVRFNPEELRKAARMQALMGAAWNRDELLWDLCEPQPGQWDWTRFDRTVEACRNNHILILGLLDYWGKWAKSFSDAGYSAYANYVKEVINRYKPHGQFAQLKGWKDGYGIRHWEIWNEPATFWSGTPEQFGRLLKTAYRAAKDADPNCVVFFANAGPSFDEKVLKAAGKDCFDGITPHYYVGPKSPIAGNVEMGMQRTVQFFQQQNIARPLWISEMGWQSTDQLETQQRQAYFLVRSYVMALANKMDKVLWYNFVNDRRDKKLEEFGLVNREDFTPKMGYGAYAAMVYALDGASYSDRLDFAPSVRCYIFSKDKGAIAVLWNDGTEGALEARLPPDAELLDIMANKVSPELLRKSAAAAPSQQASTITYPIYKIPLSPDPHYVLAPTTSAAELKKLWTTAKLYGIASVLIDIVPLKGALAELPALAVKISNYSPDEISGEVNIAPPEAWIPEAKSIKFSQLKPKDYTVVNFKFGQMPHNAENLYPIKINVITAEAAQAVAEKIMSELVAVKGTPKIDGDLSDWPANVRWVYLNDPSQVVGLEPWADWNLSARCTTMWDEENFYFASKVTDNAFHQPHTGSLVWQGDNFQLGFDCANNKGRAADDPGHYVYGLSLTSKGTETYRWLGGGRPEGPVTENAELAIKKTDENKIIYEARLSSQLLQPLKFQPQSRFGFTILLNDNDGGGRRGWLEWTPGIGTGNDASYFTEWQLVNK